MGIFLPLVLYVTSRKRYEGWPTNPYLKAKIDFLSEERDALLPFCEYLKKHPPAEITFGVREYRGALNIIEEDVDIKSSLNSRIVDNSCTLLLADPRDMLRNKRDIASDMKGSENSAINRAILNEIDFVEKFLSTYTPFIFVPGFSFAPYRNPFTQKASDGRQKESEPPVVSAYNKFFEQYIGSLNDKKKSKKDSSKFYQLKGDELRRAAYEFMDLQDQARSHIQERIRAIKSAP